MSKLKNGSALVLCNRVAEYRKSAALSQSQLAELVGTSINTISAIETNKYEPSLRLALLLSMSLEVSVHKLFYFSLK